MTAADFIFYFFAGLTLLCGVLVILNPFSRNPVTSAMFLALTIVSMAGLFVLLHAFFLAAVQVLVYAGAVMVLFLFVIMLLNVREEEAAKFRTASVVSGVAAAGAIGAMLCKTLIAAAPSSIGPAATLEGAPVPALEGATAPLGMLLFDRFLLPFEILSLLLLVAMVGVILLSKKDLK